LLYHALYNLKFTEKELHNNYNVIYYRHNTVLPFGFSENDLRILAPHMTKDQFRKLAESVEPSLKDALEESRLTELNRVISAVDDRQLESAINRVA